jgi:hypothetical protein
VGPRPYLAANQVKNTTTNQSSVPAVFGVLLTRWDSGRMCGGDEFASFGVVMNVTKKEEKFNPS